jgi:hypothetical protein
MMTSHVSGIIIPNVCTTIFMENFKFSKLLSVAMNLSVATSHHSGETASLIFAFLLHIKEEILLKRY